MTTAGRATFDTAKGGKGKWEGDLSAQSKQYSARDMPSHTRLKYRQEGQGRTEEVRGRDFRKELELRESRHQNEKNTKNPLASSASTSGAIADKGYHRALPAAVVPAAPSTSQPVAAKKARTEAPVNPDADEPLEELYAEDADASSSEEESAEEEDDGEIMAELARIRQERAEEMAKQEAEKKVQEERIRMENILKGNPLIVPATAGESSNVDFKVKRRWDDDVVFKNCARGEVDKAKRGFINDTLRSEFHKKFMDRYIQ